MNRRVYNEKISINTTQIKQFFSHRAIVYDDKHPVVSMLYQDQNPELAELRDRIEKEKLTPLLEIKEFDRVLDVGCGVGRWAEVFIGRVKDYHGTDLIDGLIRIAITRYSHVPNYSFQIIPAQDLSPENLTSPPPFDIIIIAGVLNYINDDDCLAILKNVEICSSKNSRILIRCPIGVIGRLTLDSTWSDELKYNYSSIYRTNEEYLDLFHGTLIRENFKIIQSAPLFPNELNNRKDTQQYYYLFRREYS